MSLFELWVIGVLCLLSLHACELAWERWRNTEIRYVPPHDDGPGGAQFAGDEDTWSDARQEKRVAPSYDPDADTWDEIKVDADQSAPTLPRP